MAQNWMMDPKTRDYVLNKGAPVQTDSLQVPAYFRLKIQQGSWMYQPDPTYGSRFDTLKKRRTTSDASDAEDIAILALQPLLDDGRASQVYVEAKSVRRQGVGLQAKLVNASGQIDQLDIPSLGV